MILDFVSMLRSAGQGMMDGSVFGPKEGYEQACKRMVQLQSWEDAMNLVALSEGVNANLLG